MAKQDNLIYLNVMAAKLISIILFLLSKRLQEIEVGSKSKTDIDYLEEL